MSPTLRLIAVHVEETGSRQYEWVLTERSPDKEWAELDRAKEAVSTYKEAMAAGLLSLQALVDDLDIGPREQGGPAATDGPSTVDAADAPEPPAARRSLFGFGPAR